MLLLLGLLAASLTYGLETYEGVDIELFGGGIQLKRVPKALYVTHTVDSIPMSDFRFVLSFADEQLMEYFSGRNIAFKKVPYTTPLYFQLDILDLSTHPRAAYLIPKALRETAPAPYRNLQLWRTSEKYYFVKPMNSTDFSDVLHEAADLLTDLSYNRMPFKDSKVMLAFYQFPYQLEKVTKPNEIWVERDLKKTYEFEE